MLNLFRIAGDISHLVSILILLQTIEKGKTTSGISLKTQILYVVVFVTRYLDLLTTYVSLYNSLMKIFFIASSVYVVWLMTSKYNKKFKEDQDVFPVKYLVGGSFVMSLLFHYKFTFSEILWSFSLWLEAVCILPQLFLLQKTGEAKAITTHYIFALGLYRALYIPNWFYRYYSENRLDLLSVSAGLLQTTIYSDFFYVYYQKVLKNWGFNLPQ
ncbi:unnamed protein product [Kuraishia capsulata CBS 1993]|uniref:ER lumen protein-retaining receptor n=1 Tax=Kuraishia capsulata CBS 1993 TaxID=1382522 RepID=W6MW96_9ASCO|nr:uncharacterized protein KUCA_T00003037001 [Kuraishia capsulata CBS 1993]CDK27060.1 unnamed protein product [Kuraishia capsulata CBS 1993]